MENALRELNSTFRDHEVSKVSIKSTSRPKTHHIVFAFANKRKDGSESFYNAFIDVGYGSASDVISTILDKFPQSGLILNGIPFLPGKHKRRILPNGTPFVF